MPLCYSFAANRNGHNVVSKSGAARPHLVLGTVQLGLPYGIANTTGMPSDTAASGLVAAAVAAGIRDVDTARAYGVAEERVGAALAGVDGVTIVTKLAPLAEAGSREQALAKAAASLTASRKALRRDRLDVLLLHDAWDRTAFGGAVWDWLRGERDAGRIGRIGVSVHTTAEAEAALADADVTQIQLPYNLIDTRWERLRATFGTRADVTVHVRSVYLQGLLANPAAPWPAFAGVDTVALRALLARLVSTFGRQSLADLSLAFVRAQDFVDGIVLGMERREQLAANLALFATPPLDAAQCRLVRDALPPLPDAFLDPAQWPARAAGDSVS
jgi:spore coat polysaccharide biosynthesis protein SpsF